MLMKDNVSYLEQYVKLTQFHPIFKTNVMAGE